tara:strand:- start:379 stop:648 length:270 start_codon:yes stop_codon:yes gene_type:complete
MTHYADLGGSLQGVRTGDPIILGSENGKLVAGHILTKGPNDGSVYLVTGNPRRPIIPIEGSLREFVSNTDNGAGYDLSRSRRQIRACKI